MANEVTTIRPQMMAGGRPMPIIPQSLEDCYRLASAVIKAKMTPRGIDTPEQATIIIMRGLEVGLTPFQALDKIALVNGRPTIWGDGALGLVLASGLCEDLTEHIEGQGDGRVAVCRTWRKGREKPITGKFSVSDAKAAGLWGKQGPWQQYQERMLQMRARAYALRDGYADVLGGLYMREEFDLNRPNMPPRQPLASKLDALANDPGTGEIYENGAEDPPHDPETGEIVSPQATNRFYREPEEVAAGWNRTPESTEEELRPVSQEEALRQAAAAREELEATAREMALSGRREFDKWYTVLTPEQQQTLAPHMKVLMDAANKAGRK